MRQRVTLPAIRKQRERNTGVQHSCFFLFMPVPVRGMMPVTFRVCLSSSVEPVWKIPHSPSDDCLPCDAKSSHADNQRYPSCLAKIPPSSSRAFQKLPTYVHPADLQLPLVSLSFPLHFHLFSLFGCCCVLWTPCCVFRTPPSLPSQQWGTPKLTMFY